METKEEEMLEKNSQPLCFLPGQWELCSGWSTEHLVSHKAWVLWQQCSSERWGNPPKLTLKYTISFLLLDFQPWLDAVSGSRCSEPDNPTKFSSHVQHALAVTCTKPQRPQSPAAAPGPAQSSAEPETLLGAVTQAAVS